ncbi:hypothetical protein TNCV_3513131 [Trichonephila clavipes]|nr:hypothetical protein TNCV_3513131 [Trichonephila clavipes]
MSAEPNLFPEICSMEVVTHRQREIDWCTIVFGPHIVGCCVRTPFCNCKVDGKLLYVQVSSQPYHNIPNLICFTTSFNLIVLPTTTITVIFSEKRGLSQHVIYDVDTMLSSITLLISL